MTICGFEHQALARQAPAACADADVEQGMTVTRLVRRLRELADPAGE